MMCLLFSAAFASGAVVTPGGALEIELDGKRVSIGVDKTVVNTHIAGDIATVRLSQTFTNPSAKPMEGTYVFPLPENAAVHAMTLRTPTAVIEAEIHERKEAEAKFAKAKAEGKQAAVLHQQRPNVFEQRVANLGPGESFTVELEYAHTVPRKDGAYRYLFPMVVAPRFSPADAHPVLPTNTWTVGTGADLPPQIESERLELSVTLDGGLPVQSVSSPTHRIHATGEGTKTVRLAGGPVPNVDFLLQYELAAQAVGVGTVVYADGGRGVVSLLVEPPAMVPVDQIAPREMVFVLDTSGSMGGEPMDASKRFMSAALESLRPGDHFRIVKFANDAQTYSAGSVPANAETVSDAVAYVNGLQAGGGTQMRPGMEAALGPKIPTGAVRIVVFLTDGHIGNDGEVVELVESLRGEARLFSFGIGRSVNRWLIEELARSGRGSARVVLEPGAAVAAAEDLAKRLEAPLLTNVKIDWGNSGVREVTPEVLPDLFGGDSLRILGRFDKPGTHRVTVTGLLGGKPASLPVDLVLPAEALGPKALQQVWARSLVEDRMHAYMAPRTGRVDRLGRDQLQQQVTTLGLEYGLVTQWTSFLAVGPEADVPAQAGWAGSQGPSFGGSAAPEPVTWLAGMLVLGLGGLATRKGRNARA